MAGANGGSRKSGPTKAKGVERLPGTWSDRAKAAAQRVINDRMVKQMAAVERGDKAGAIQWGARRGFAQETLNKLHRRDQRREDTKRAEAHWAEMRAKKSASSDANKSLLAQLRAGTLKI